MPRVLIVDNSKVVLSIVQTYLMKLRAEFEVAVTAEEGLEVFRARPADIVVTDCHLPGMNGMELAEKIKESATSDVKVILISSARDLRTEDARDKGVVDAFLPKPLNGKKLQQEVSRLLMALAAEDPGRASLVPDTRTRVVAADDTEVGRRILERIIRADGELELVGIARDGAEAVAMVAELKPDVVLLDALMPVLDGIAATRRIMQSSPTRVVIVTEHHSMQGASVAFAAQHAGALELLPRPSWGDAMGREATEFREKLKEIAEIPVIGRRPRTMVSRPSAASGRLRERAGVIAICASTGGPAALATLLPKMELVRESPCVLIVQHVLPGFDVALADWLREVTKCPVELASTGATVSPGTVLLAPDGRHMRLVNRERIEVFEGPPVLGHRPSGNPLFESVAEYYGREGLGIVLTGMGSDGVEGCAKLKEAGGTVMVQSPHSCVVPGMPDAVIARGVADAVLPLDELVREMRALAALR